MVFCPGSLGNHIRTKIIQTTQPQATTSCVCAVLQAVITATVQPEGHPASTITRQVDLVLWGCGFLVGDASAPPAAIPAGMTQPNMQQQQQLTAAAAKSEPNLM